MGATEDTLALLRSIDASLKRLVAVLATSAPKAVADARDLDGKYGNPVVKGKDPRDWTGPSMRGRTFSECPPEYLDLLAERCDYFADVAEREGRMTDSGKPKAEYERRDAARARGWAARIRAGHAPVPVVRDEPSDMLPPIDSWDMPDDAWGGQ